MQLGGGGGRGYSDISYIRRLGPFLGVQNLQFQYFWVLSEKRIFLGYEYFVDIFLGSSQN